MKKEIIISATLSEIRVAITENNKLSELFWELPDQERNVGNIFLGRVTRIVQGMNAAFIDVGLKQDCFLHFSDIGDSLDEEVSTDEEEEDDSDVQRARPISDEELSEEASVALRRKRISSDTSDLPTFATKRSGNVVINLEEGQTILVQGVREAYGTKGLRVTTKISMPGRYVVFLPFDGTIGVSKKIYNVRERRRLRRIARQILPEGIGCIIRTEAMDKDDATIIKDFEHLLMKWNAIESQVKRSIEPRIVHRDASLTVSLMRDLLTADVTRVITDSKKIYKEIVGYLEWAAPNRIKSVEYYRDKDPIFDKFRLEGAINNTFNQSVSLPSGGYLIFDHTEALTVIDVNSGRYAADREQEINSLTTNLEAAEEVARQIRLRDIGGMIIIDFIDLQDERNKRKLYERMKNELRKDRAKAVVFPLTQLGLMQITRQRIRQNIFQTTTDPCPTCNGKGTIHSKVVVMNSIERWLGRCTASQREFRLKLSVHPAMAYHLKEGKLSRLTRIMLKFFIKIDLRVDERLHYTDFRFWSYKHQSDITDNFL